MLLTAALSFLKSLIYHPKEKLKWINRKTQDSSEKRSLLTKKSENNTVQMTEPSSIQKTMDYLIHKAELRYSKEKCGKCAAFVRGAVEFGFSRKMGRAESAKDYGVHYEKFGFKKIYSFTPEDEPDYEPGDVAIIQYEPHGHIAMFCKGIDPKTGKEIECWISDFRQPDPYGGKIRDKFPHFDVYRYDINL